MKKIKRVSFDNPYSEDEESKEYVKNKLMENITKDITWEREVLKASVQGKVASGILGIFGELIGSDFLTTTADIMSTASDVGLIAGTVSAGGKAICNICETSENNRIISEKEVIIKEMELLKKKLDILEEAEQKEKDKNKEQECEYGYDGVQYY